MISSWVETWNFLVPVNIGANTIGPGKDTVRRCLVSIKHTVGCYGTAACEHQNSDCLQGVGPMRPQVQGNWQGMLEGDNNRLKHH